MRRPTSEYEPRTMRGGASYVVEQAAAIERAAEGLDDVATLELNDMLDGLYTAIQGSSVAHHGHTVRGLGAQTLLEILGAIGIRFALDDYPQVEEDGHVEEV